MPADTEISLLGECEVPDGAAAWIEAPLTVLAERTGPLSCTVLLTTEDGIRALNREFRGRDAVTDVLSFPSRAPGDPPEPDGFAGDIAVCVAQAERQAVELGHPLERELAFLALHGALHLLGRDHEDPDEAERMYAEQRDIMREALRRLGTDAS